jgi:ABC-type phosphate/phosphonate transport system substrate-binding protein
VLETRRRSAAYEPIAAPVLQGERCGGRPVYFSDVIVRSDSDISSFDDLRGRSFAYNERPSHSGYGVVRFALVEMGETHGFFGSVVESGAYQESIRMVARLSARDRRGRVVLSVNLPGMVDMCYSV